MTSPRTTRIADLPRHVGETVTVRGWVTHLRSSGKVAFIVLRDGSGILQAVVLKPKANVTDGTADGASSAAARSWEAFATLTQETSIAITGEVRADTRAPGGVELGTTALAVVGPSPLDYPIQPKEHGVDFLLDHRHLWLR